MNQDTARLVQQHYETPQGNDERISSVMARLEHTDTLSTTQLAPLDQFHLGGLATTKKLAELAGIEKHMKILDAGSGLGGPSRYLAETFGCTVVGVDITPSFVNLAKFLAQRTGLSNLVSYEVGNLLDLPFDDNAFEVVWTQHVVMNIREREKVYREFHRVLSPGGKLAFFDVVASDDKPELHFPVPWAESNTTSFLLTKAETINVLQQAGFEEGNWHDVTELSVQALANLPMPVPDDLNLRAVMGPRFSAMLANFQRNLSEGRVRLVMGVYDRGSVS
jgi:sarcosine/dimethylglycine N-methyltransferase